jgi:uncharacterized protein (TIGR00255 family)
MLKSMTGFGRSTYEGPLGTIVVELKTLNSKQTDIYCRLSRILSAKEIELRNTLTAKLERGKIELILSFHKAATTEATSLINRPLLATYITDLSEASKNLGLDVPQENLWNQALLMPNALMSDNTVENISEQEWALILEHFNKAIDHCNDFRLREGNQLTGKFSEYIQNIENNLVQVMALDGQRIPSVKERIKKQLEDLLGDDQYDKNRFEQELVYYIEKYDISEEKQRLTTHLNYFKEILASPTNGKKLGFMAQEIGREINTIGSKANDSGIQRLVVDMKDELEKIKEQTANVL